MNDVLCDLNIKRPDLFADGSGLITRLSLFAG
jgi:hypothetical protein